MSQSCQRILITRFLVPQIFAVAENMILHICQMQMPSFSFVCLWVGI